MGFIIGREERKKRSRFGGRKLREFMFYGF